MRKSSAANSVASSPPVPARISSTTLRVVVGVLGRELDAQLAPRARRRAASSCSRSSSAIAQQLVVLGQAGEHLLGLVALARAPCGTRGRARPWADLRQLLVGLAVGLLVGQHAGLGELAVQLVVSSSPDPADVRTFTRLYQGAGKLLPYRTDLPAPAISFQEARISTEIASRFIISWSVVGLTWSSSAARFCTPPRGLQRLDDELALVVATPRP